MSTYIRLLRYLKRHAGLFSLAVCCMLASTLLKGIELGSIFPFADRIVTDKAIPSPGWLPVWLAGFVAWLNAMESTKLLAAFALTIPVLFVFKCLFEFCQTFFMNDTANRVIRDLRQAIFERFISLPIAYHNKAETGRLMSRITYDVGVIQNSITEGCTDLVLQGSQVAMFLSIALTIDWKLSLFIFLLVPAILFPIMKIGKILKKLSHRAQESVGRLNTTILESLTGIRVIKAFVAEAHATARFASANQRAYSILRKSQKRMNSLAPITEFIAACAGAAFFWYGGRQVISGAMTLGTFLVYLGAILSLIRPFKRLARLHAINLQALAAGERIFEVLDAPVTITEHPKARILPPFHKEIKFEHVSFHYGSKPALRDVSLIVPAGESLALVGPSGGGKSTLISLLHRFYDPSAGRVKIDGLDLRHVTLSSLRSQVGLVTQETFLFNDTVAANLAIGRPNARMEEIVEAAKAANAHEFIEALPKGYDTVIGEQGGSLSGGERQRIAIARALLKSAPILILDEATNQLDAESEHFFTEALKRLCHGRTVIMIAHRISSVRMAHRIVLLQEGRIVERGSHDDLLQKSPLYRRFCELQLIHTGKS